MATLAPPRSWPMATSTRSGTTSWRRPSSCAVCEGW